MIQVAKKLAKDYGIDEKGYRLVLIVIKMLDKRYIIFICISSVDENGLAARIVTNYLLFELRGIIPLNDVITNLTLVNDPSAWICPNQKFARTINQLNE